MLTIMGFYYEFEELGGELVQCGVVCVELGVVVELEL